MTPRPGARGRITSQTTGRAIDLLITAARSLGEASSVEPATVVGVEKGGIALATGGGDVLITQVKPAGKKEMSAFAFANGYRISVGDLFQRKE